MKPRGFILATVFFLLVILVFLAASLFRLVPGELNWALRQRIDTEAYYAATGGLKHSLSWLAAVQARKLGSAYNPPYEPFGVVGDTEAYKLVSLHEPSVFPYKLLPAVLPSGAGPDDTYYPADLPALQLRSERLQFANDWTAHVTIVPDKWTAPHPFLAGQTSSKSPCYTIVSVAYQDGNHNGQCDTAAGEHYALRLECSVVAGTFSRYAYFVDRWFDQGANSIRISLPSGNPDPVFGGPVHTNGVPILQVASQNGFWSEVTGGTAVPHFSSDLTFAGAAGETYANIPVPVPNRDGIAWFLGNFNGTNQNRVPFDLAASALVPIGTRYERIFKNGQASVRPRDRIDLPADSDRVALAAWGYRRGESYPNPADIPSNELYVRTDATGKIPLGGGVLSGGLKSCLFDIIDTDSKSVANDTYNCPVPAAGAGALKLVHQTGMVYVAGTANVPIYTTSVYEATGTYYTTQYSSTGPGTPTTTQVLASMGTTEFLQVQYGPGSLPIYDVPGGGAVGGAPSIPNQPIATVTVTQNVPIYSQSQIFEQVTGPLTGVYTATDKVPTGATSQKIVLDYYNPTDLVVEPKEARVLLANTYLQASDAPPIVADDPVSSSIIASFRAQPPIILNASGLAPGETGYVKFPVETNKTAVLRQSHTDPRVYYLQDLDASLNGDYLVMGNITGMKGWNRGRKTFQAEKRTWNGAGVSTATAYSMSIAGPIRQFGVTQGTVPPNGDNSLGLIAKEIVITAPESMVDPADPAKFSFVAPKRPMYIYSALLALGGQFRTDFNTIPTKTSVLRVVGSVVQQNIGFLYNTSQSVGWFNDYTYDPSLTEGPPPAFPLDGTFQIYFFRVDPL